MDNCGQVKYLKPPFAKPPFRLSRPCRTVFHVVSQTIAATPPLLSIKMVYRNPKTGLGRRASQKKLSSEAYCAIGGVARNSVANRAKVSRERRSVWEHAQGHYKRSCGRQRKIEKVRVKFRALF